MITINCALFPELYIHISNHWLFISGCATVSSNSTLLYSTLFLYSTLRLPSERRRVTHMEKGLWAGTREWEWMTARDTISDHLQTLKPVLPWTFQWCEPILLVLIKLVLIKLVFIGFLSLEIKSLDHCFRFCLPWVSDTNLWSLPSYWEVACSAKKLNVCEIPKGNFQKGRQLPMKHVHLAIQSKLGTERRVES